jgi:hypothetical protein
MSLLSRPACMTAEQAERFGTKRVWWVIHKGERGDTFVDLGVSKLATEPLRIDLAPGDYLIGAGPPDHYREFVEVSGDGTIENPSAEPDEVARLPCITPRCEGIIVCEAGSMPPSCEPFDLDPPAARLCGACFGGGL